MKIEKISISTTCLETELLLTVKVMPKEILQILKNLILQYTMKDITQNYISHIILVTSNNKPIIKDHVFDRSTRLNSKKFIKINPRYYSYGS